MLRFVFSLLRKSLRSPAKSTPIRTRPPRNRRVCLDLEALETRDCPAAPVITSFTAQAIDSTNVQLTGTLTDDDPASCLVGFSGAASGSTWADTSGNFSLVTAISYLGEVDAQAVDGMAQGSNIAQADITMPAPVLSVSDFSYINGSLTLGGQVSAPSPSGLFVSFSGAVNDMTTTDGAGSFSLTTSNCTAGTITVQTCDTWGQWSNMVTLIFSPPDDQNNDVGDQVDITLPASGQLDPASGQISGPLTWDITGLPDGLTADRYTGEITGTINPGDDANSPYLVTASITDAAGNVATVTFHWVVVLANVWNPPNAGNLLFSNDMNWSAGHVPRANEIAVYDGGVNQNSCILDQDATVQGLTFRNGYTGTLDIGNPNNGQAFNLTVTNGADLSNLDQNQAYSTAWIDFVSSSSRLYLSGTNVFRNFDCFGVQGLVQLRSGSLNILTPANGLAETTANFIITGTLYLQNSTSFSFTNGAGLKISAGASANILNMNNTVLDDAGGGGGFFENYGTITYQGSRTTTTEIDMAILNAGTINLAGSGGGGGLRFGSSAAVPNYTYGFVMASGYINLSEGISLYLWASGYEQWGGTVSVTDNSSPAMSSAQYGFLINDGVFRFTSSTGYGSLLGGFSQLVRSLTHPHRC